MTPPPAAVLIVCGDPSGDWHGSRLAAAMKRLDPSLNIIAVGGPLMRQQAQEFLEDLASRGISGFWEPLLHLKSLARLYGRLKALMSERKPRALVCVDYYGFNRWVLHAASALGIPAYYYVSPQVWASRPGRVKVLKRLVRKMLVIFPFEERVYREAEVPCVFIGHPLLDVLPPPTDIRALMELKDPVRVGLLPGSRPGEVRRHLPIFLEAYRRIKIRFPSSKALVFAARGLSDDFYDLSSCPGAELVRESDYSARRELDFAISSSGTATLENALLGVPMVVAYRTSWLTYAIARMLIRVPYISIVNILSGRALVPEAIQGQANAEHIASLALRALENPAKYAQAKRDLFDIRGLLGQSGAPEKAAKIVLSNG